MSPGRLGKMSLSAKHKFLLYSNIILKLMEDIAPGKH